MEEEGLEEDGWDTVRDVEEEEGRWVWMFEFECALEVELDVEGVELYNRGI